MRKNHYRRGLALLLALCMVSGCIACGSGASAASIFLRKIEGAVRVSDAEGQNVEVREKLGLFNGYGVNTEQESYAWIDLDQTKLAKLDENSEAAITKEDKMLSIDVKTGSMFFNVSEPLADDETMDICTSTMMVGIRGTCGWVEAPDEQHMLVYLLEGTVECTAGEQTTTINAGEMAAMTADGTIEARKFGVSDIPDFIRTELEEDEKLIEQIKAASGLDVTAKSLREYEEALSLWLHGDKLVFAEEFDFEGDGSPELLVLYPYSDTGDDLVPVGFMFFREEPDGYVQLGTGSTSIDTNEAEKISLVESDGRLYIMIYSYIPAYDDHTYRYCGSIADQDGGPGSWGDLDYAFRTGDKYRIGMPTDSPTGIGGNSRDATADEYAATLEKYTELRVLVDGEMLKNRE